MEKIEIKESISVKVKSINAYACDGKCFSLSDSQEMKEMPSVESFE